MCGFLGWIGNSGIDKNEFIKIGFTMKHRGPDDCGFLLKENFGLGFRRLSILDLSENGHQPMSILNESKHIVFNGEIYNESEIRKGLEKDNIEFKGNSDTEVLLHFLSGKGENALPHLNGMFSFCFIDENSGRFLIARDRLGVKPLFYSIWNGVLYFASELPTLMKFGLPNEINLNALNKYVRFGNIASPETIYKNIFKLEAGSFISGHITKPVEIHLKKWYNLPLEENKNKSELQWLNEIDELLFDATKIRLSADVPTGLFLSGGIDSSLIAHYCSVQDTFKKPKAISVIFDEKEFSEYEIAKEVASSKSLELITLKLQGDKLNNIDPVLKNVGEPFSDSSIINQYYLSLEAKKHATVFLSGDGGDEAFAGYVEYIKSYGFNWNVAFASTIAKVFYSPLSFLFKDDNNLKQQLAKLSVGPEYMGTSIRMNFNEPILTKLLAKTFQVSNAELTDQIFSSWKKTEGMPLVKRMQIHDYGFYLEPDVLAKVDRSTMANSIEARSPFLDYRIVELGLSVPNEFNIMGNQGKYLLRKLAERHLPASVCRAPKKGFGLPFRSWITESLKKDVLNLVKANNHGYWDESVLSFVVSNADSKTYDMDTIFWRIWMFEIWYKQAINNN
jgi:asparagine synthase (glutamine-hydrolysing)